MIVKILLTLLLFATLVSDTLAQNAFVSTDKDTVAVGDILRYSIVIENPDSQPLLFPDSTAFGDDLEFVNRRMFRSNGVDSVVYRLQFFGTEDSSIPELAIFYQNYSDSIFALLPDYPLYFQSLIAGEDEELRPLKSIYSFSRSVWPSIFWLLILAGVLYAGWYYYQKYRTKEPEVIEPLPPPPPPKPFINPLDTLRETLEKLTTKYTESVPDNKTYFSDYSEAIRTYLEEVYEILALESTTSEILRMLRTNYAHEDVIKLTSDILKLSDMVKFAKFEPSEKDRQFISDQAQAFYEYVSHHDTHRIEALRRRFNAEQESQNEGVLE